MSSIMRPRAANDSRPTWLPSPSGGSTVAENSIVATRSLRRYLGPSVDLPGTIAFQNDINTLIAALDMEADQAFEAESQPLGLPCTPEGREPDIEVDFGEDGPPTLDSMATISASL